MENKKILILTPAYTAKGGIANYFKALEGKIHLPIEYFTRGSRNWPIRQNSLLVFRRSILDIIRYHKLLRSDRYWLVQTNTSLGKFSIIRDGLFLKIAQYRKLSTLVFFRGWDESFEKRLTGIFFRVFKTIYFNTNTIIVLSSSFKNKLLSWGYCGKIVIESTLVDDELVKDFSISDVNKRLDEFNISNLKLLFLARTEIRKGLYETIDAFRILKQRLPNATLTISGDGFELENAKDYVKELGISDVKFTGFVTGEEKINVFRNSDLFLFPSYTEGMPNSVLEAMAFGLPVITTPVGGLVDFFEDWRHGLLIQQNNGEAISEDMKELLSDIEKYKQISIDNYHYSHSRFTTSSVAERLENIYKTLNKNI